VSVVWAVVGLLAAVHAGYALWIARRLDRLHQRVDVSSAALDAQLRVRAQAAVEAADTVSGIGSSHAAEELRRTAARALSVEGLGHDRERVENALSRALMAVGESAELDPTLTEALNRANYARAFRNDAVRDAQVVRRRRIVRVFRLAGSARMPTFFEMDDASVMRRTIDV
jgi:hypothetical protein